MSTKGFPCDAKAQWLSLDFHGAVFLKTWRVQGQVTHFVSWCWAYSLKNVVSAVGRWLQNSGEDPRDVFLWMCFFCNNQYRIQDESWQQSCRLFRFCGRFRLRRVIVPYQLSVQASQTGSDDLREIFESHLVEAGHMLVLLDTIVPGA